MLKGLTKKEREAVEDAILNTYYEFEDSGDADAAKLLESANRKLFGGELK